jgi:hypothetical protein
LKYSLLTKGKRAERKLACPYPIEGSTETGMHPCVAIPMSGDEEAECLSFAIKFAKDKGVPVELAKTGQPIFDLGYMAKVVELTVRDPDEGEPGRRPPTFPGGPDEVLGELQRETILYLFKISEEWSDICSPQRRSLSDADMLEGVRRLAAEGDDGLRFFGECGPSLRFSFMRFTARMLWSSLEGKSTPGSSTATRRATSTRSTASPREKSRTSAGSFSTKRKSPRSG